jgi:hypothetical protein
MFGGSQGRVEGSAYANGAPPVIEIGPLNPRFIGLVAIPVKLWYDKQIVYETWSHILERVAMLPFSKCDFFKTSPCKN